MSSSAPTSVTLSSVHIVPFQVSTSGDPTFEMSTPTPTATHSVLDVHEIDSRSFSAAGLGLRRIVQAAPSHVIANVSMPPEPVEPIAKQKVGETQETERKELSSPGLLGVGTIAQPAPSHVIANVWSTAVPSLMKPTAVQKSADVQTTDVR
jgi:hypothetical protein